MKLQRARRALLLVAATALATPVLAGCATAEPGAAAVVGSTRIEESTIGEQLRAVNEAAGRPADEPSVEISRALVSYNVGYELVDQAATDLGVTVTPGVIDRAYDEQVKSFGTEEALFEAAAQQGIPAQNLRRDLTTQLLVSQIAQKVAPGAEQGVQQTRLIEAISAYAERVGVAVAPKYGEWDDATLQIGPPADPVSQPAQSEPALVPMP